MAQQKEENPIGKLHVPFQAYGPNLTKRNKALLYALVAFSFLLYLVSFVRMGKW